MSFLAKWASFPFRKSSSKENQPSWAVILKGVPDKKVEEVLIRLFTEKLDVPGDDALKVVRSAPIILFDERTSREAEHIKLILNKTGARTAISNDPHEFKRFPRVAWPRRINVEDLGAGLETASPLAPPSTKSPISPPPPSKPFGLPSSSAKIPSSGPKIPFPKVPAPAPHVSSNEPQLFGSESGEHLQKR